MNVSIVLSKSVRVWWPNKPFGLLVGPHVRIFIEDIQTSELHFKNMDQTGQRNYVLGYLTNHSQLQDSGQYKTEFFVKGKSVCREAWLLIHSINKEWFRRLFLTFKDGAVELEHGNKGQKKPSRRCLVAVLSYLCWPIPTG